MGVDVLTETLINRPRDEVAAYASDPSNAPEWYVNIESVTSKTARPVGVGSRMEFALDVLRSITDHDPIPVFAHGVNARVEAKAHALHLEHIPQDRGNAGIGYLERAIAALEDGHF